MPIFDYKCPACGHVYRDIPGRDRVWCVCKGQRPDGSIEDVECERLPAAPAFSIRGYSAKTGYSSKG
jgi:rubredoxin